MAVLALGGFAAAGGASTLTPNEAYVTRLYLDLLGRSPSAGELSTWTGQLGGGASRAPVVNSLTSSAEARTRLVRLAYLALLHRTPTPVEESQTVNRLAAGGAVEELVITMASSDEYVQGRGGTDTGWLTALYVELVGRSITQNELDQWLSLRASGTSRQSIATSIRTSTEVRQRAVRGLYLLMLRRPATSAEVAAHTADLAVRGRYETIGAALLASDEYFALAGTGPLPTPTAGTVTATATATAPSCGRGSCPSTPTPTATATVTATASPCPRTGCNGAPSPTATVTATSTASPCVRGWCPQ